MFLLAVARGVSCSGRRARGPRSIIGGFHMTADRRARICAAVAVLIGITASGLVAVAQAADAATQEGTPLSPRPQTPFASWSDGPGSASNTYVAIVEQPYDEAAVRTQVIRRISDGAVMRTIADPVPNSQGSPSVMENSIVQLSAGDPHGPVDTLRTTDIATGVATTLAFPAGAPLDYGPGWVLTCDRQPSSADCDLRLLTSSGVNRRVGVTAARLSMSVPDGPGRAVVVSSTADARWAVDTATGESEQLPYLPVEVIAGGRAFWREDDRSAGSQRTILRSAKLDGTDESAVVVDTPLYGQSLLRYGQRIALLRAPEDGSFTRQELRPVNLVTGALEPPVARSIHRALPLPDGRLVLALADTPSGRVAVVDDGAAPTTVMEMPPVGIAVDDLTLSAGMVAATWSAGADEDQDIYFSSTAPGSQWSTTAANGVEGVEHSRATGAAQYSGGTLVTQIPGSQSAGGDGYLVDWGSGARSVVSASSPVRVGHGGALVSRSAFIRGSGVPRVTEIQDARTGTVRMVLPASAAFDLDGTWIWTFSADRTALVGTDTSSGAIRDRPIGQSCGQSVSVIQNWALVSCDGSNAYAVDLTGSADSWRVPLPEQFESLVLGGGFAAWVPAQTDDAARIVRVVSFASSHEVRTYGPARGEVYQPGPTLATDDSGMPALVYADSRHQPRLVDTSWAVPAPASGPPSGPAPGPSSSSDTAPPSLGAVRVTPALGRRPGGVATVSFSASDAVGPVSYTVSQRAHRGSRGFSAWTEPADWSGLTSTSVRSAIGGGTTECFRVRARDGAGNASAWSAEHCSSSPLDDRSLASKGAVKRSKDRAAMGRTVSVLAKKGASLLKRSQRVHGVYVMARRGPKEGAVKVYVGPSLVGTVDLKSSASGIKRVLVSSRVERRGDVRLVSTSRRPARVDGIALLP